VKNLSELIAATYGGGFEQVFPVPAQAGESETVGGDPNSDGAVVVCFGAGHPLNVLNLSQFTDSPFPPSVADGWGGFASGRRLPMMSAIVLFNAGTPGEDPLSSLFESFGLRATEQPGTGDGAEAAAAAEPGAQGSAADKPADEVETDPAAAAASEGEELEVELVPAYAYALFERVGEGFALAGSAIILAKAPKADFVQEEGEIFDANSAPWLRIASRDYDPNEPSILDVLIKSAVKGLGVPYVYALIDDYIGESFAGLEAKIVATVEVDNGEYAMSIVEVKLPVDQPAAEAEPAGGEAAGAAVIEPNGDDVLQQTDGVVEGAGGVQHVVDESLIEHPQGEGEGVEHAGAPVVAEHAGDQGEHAKVTE
jgi:hypothetical protein